MISLHDNLLLITHRSLTLPRPQETAWPLPVPMTVPVAPHPPAYPAHRHARWSAGISVAG
jgi:hypothetical protein